MPARNRTLLALAAFAVAVRLVALPWLIAPEARADYVVVTLCAAGELTHVYLDLATGEIHEEVPDGEPPRACPLAIASSMTMPSLPDLAVPVAWQPFAPRAPPAAPVVLALRVSHPPARGPPLSL